MDIITKKILSIALLMLLAIGVAADDDIDPDADVNVTVSAPLYVSEDTFEVTINVTEVSDMCSAQFDLTFDPDVIYADKSDVGSGMIDDRELPISSCRLMEDGRIRIMIQYDNDIIDEGGVSGSGYIAKIVFEVVGDIGDTSDIDISEEQKRMLAHLEPREGYDTMGPDNTPANWFGTNVTIGTAPAASDEAPTPTPTPTETPAVNTTQDSISAPTPTETPTETESLELASNPSPFMASAQSAPAAAVPGASSEDGGLPDIPTAHDLIPIYSLVGLLALIYAIIQFK